MSAEAGAPVNGTSRVELHAFRAELTLAPGELGLVTGDTVVFRDQYGEDIGRLLGEAQADPDAIQSSIIRRATTVDLAQRDENRARADDCLRTFRHLVRQFRLPMKPVDAQLRLDRREICFYFVSDERLNFRSLHKAISAELHMRVSVRQVGVRDYCRVQGGIGACGRVLCCAGFLTELKPITLRMARQQSLFVEPSKISGVCGKLLCCLGFEECIYRTEGQESGDGAEDSE
jgi:cell fate regulator YaaT (PSP1 superfamily)